ncbi:MAG: hypothetical protein M0Z82_13980 [Actinomycetota bacterium]|nr:hypothetical protein [Actinomycetota bacterium]
MDRRRTDALSPRHLARRATVTAPVSAEEVLLLWRAVSRFRSPKNPACAPRGRSARSDCPLAGRCPRWQQADDRTSSFDEDLDATERRRASWPCSRLLDLLDPDVAHFGYR